MTAPRHKPRSTEDYTSVDAANLRLELSHIQTLGLEGHTLLTVESVDTAVSGKVHDPNQCSRRMSDNLKAWEEFIMIPTKNKDGEYHLTVYDPTRAFCPDAESYAALILTKESGREIERQRNSRAPYSVNVTVYGYPSVSISQRASAYADSYLGTSGMNTPTTTASRGD
ncbi:uncharacterized protein I206_105849 [Kwoniella pini CBS 10737]|uniref:Uncharacterized protein n=1 Tax=Kwoniella pini CBS 10737 TaxID=1296096 RepID=A0A1B9I0C3_9TREE|nr:uncharacterized protein I206_04669 [Kwoniella pini CBS 10737]OCF48982.1 hypothetical protein I206_04669 [Kwoniella pini CBS 10737]